MEPFNGKISSSFYFGFFWRNKKFSFAATNWAIRQGTDSYGTTCEAHESVRVAWTKDERQKKKRERWQVEKGVAAEETLQRAANKF
jgi:hypothetical protein